MSKIMLIAAFLVSISVLFTSCTPAAGTGKSSEATVKSDQPKTAPQSTAQPGAQPEAQAPGQGFAYNKVPFEVVKDQEKLPDGIKTSIGSISRQRGYAFFENEGGFLVFIGAGEKPTGGYSINVRAVEDIEGRTKITVEEAAPAKGDIVTQALTYPYTLIKVKGVTDNFTVVNEKGDVFKRLLPVEGAGQTPNKVYSGSGIYVGEIDLSSIEITVNGKPEVFRHDEKLAAVVESLQTEGQVAFTYTKNEYGQNILSEIKKVN